MGGLLVGRGAELELLAELVAGASGGVGGVVLVEGEQGIGKSSLLRAGLAGADAAGCRVLWGEADELGQRFPLELMTEIVAVAGGLGENGSWREGGGVLSGDPVLAGVERLLAAVDRLCAVSSVVLVAEDLQWADEASLLVWTRLCRAAGQMPLLLAGSWRPEAGREELRRLRRGVSTRGGSVVRLGPLPDAEVAKLAEGLLGGRPGRKLAGVLDRAAGNPLYARELADGMMRQGRVAVAGGVAELADDPAVVRVPASLAAAIGDRLDGLAAEAVALLRWAAVLGAEFSVTDLEVVSGRSAGELMGVIGGAVVAGVVAEAGLRLGFRHGLIRQVLYEGMPAGLRAALHGQAARALAGAGAPLGRVAVHLAAALHAPGTGAEPEPWIVQWLADAAPALTYQAPTETAELLRNVLARLPDADPRREDLQASLVRVAFQLLLHDEVENAGRQLLASTGDPDRAAEMTWLIGYSLLRTGRAADAGVTILAALARPGISQSWLARLTALHAIVQLIPGSSEVAERVTLDEGFATDAIAVAERSGDRLALAYALHAKAIIADVARDQAGVLEHTDLALAVIGEDPQATDLRLMMLANRIVAIGRSDRAEAIATARQAVVLAEQAGSPQLGLIRCALADQHFYSGQWDDALAELEPAVGLPYPSYVQIVVHGMIALIAAHREDWQTAHEYLRGLPQRLAIRPLLANCSYLLLARALVGEKAAGPARAAEILAIALDPELAPDMLDRYELLAALTRSALQVGDGATAAAAAAAAQDEADRGSVAVKAAVADHCRGLVTGDPQPVLAAAGRYEVVGVVLDQAMALEDAAALAARSGDAATARQTLAGAVRLYQALGASWDIRHAKSRLRPYGIRYRGDTAYSARPASGWEALTPTEVRVASLVAGGRSNPEIAAAMYLSRYTVQTHMSHVLAKLGARSRAEVIREALAHPAAPDLASA